MTPTADKQDPGTSFRYRLLKGFFYGLSRLPFWFLYGISNFLFFLAFYVVGYRKKVVRQNLAMAFPEKPKQEREGLMRSFYQHLFDLFVEAVKGATMDSEDLEKRIPLVNPEVIQEIAKEGKGTLIIASHYGNFEWTNACIDYYSGEVPTYTIYHQLQNPYFEQLMTEFRSRWGSTLIDKQQAFRRSLVILKKLSMIGYVSDQSPSRRQVLYFSEFLGQASAMHEGASMLAVGRNLPAYFADISKVKRGHYQCRLIRIPTENFVADKDIHGFTDYHADLLEQNIRRDPAYWLWSHRRWKHQPREGDELSVRLTEKAQQKIVS